MSEPTSAVIMETLLRTAPQKRKETLGRLKQACDDLAVRGKLRLSDIERRVAERFGREQGPRAQTISNEKTLALGMYHYVEARKREAASLALRSPHATRNFSQRNVLQQIERLEDIDLRNLMRDLYDRMLLAEAADRRSKYLLRTIRPGVDLNAVATGSAVELTPAIDEEGISTLRRLRMILTNEDKLSSCGLTTLDGHICRKGRVANELIPASVVKGFMDLCARLDRM